MDEQRMFLVIYEAKYICDVNLDLRDNLKDNFVLKLFKLFVK